MCSSALCSGPRRNGCPTMYVCSDTTQTSGCRTHCWIIRSNWSTIMSANSRGFVLAVQDLADVVEFHGIGYVEDLPAGGAEPDRLIVARPVEHVFVAGGRQQIERDIGFDSAGAEPALRRTSLVPAYGFGRV